MVEVTIEATPNGPYLVTGLIELRDADGKVLPTKSKVCRCGASTKKPFCDGTHSKIGFQAAAKAVPGSAERADRRRHTTAGHLGTDWTEVFHSVARWSSYTIYVPVIGVKSKLTECV